MEIINNINLLISELHELGHLSLHAVTSSEKNKIKGQYSDKAKKLSELRLKLVKLRFGKLTEIKSMIEKVLKEESKMIKIWKDDLYLTYWSKHLTNAKNNEIKKAEINSDVNADEPINEISCELSGKMEEYLKLTRSS